VELLVVIVLGGGGVEWMYGTMWRASCTWQQMREAMTSVGPLLMGLLTVLTFAVCTGKTIVHDIECIGIGPIVLKNKK
jgi:hypothetical protein